MPVIPATMGTPIGPISLTGKNRGTMSASAKTANSTPAMKRMTVRSYRDCILSPLAH
ncbi:MAG: hypothetical protein GXY70_04060 [Euryarchaeota archaeon]|nr:hypothetical protein [Euryarchaeota archaeon]